MHSQVKQAQDKKLGSLLPLSAIITLAISLILPWPASAINYGSGTYGSCQYGSCGITLGSSGSISVNIVPSSSGQCTIQKDAVSVLTDDSSGYTLTFTTNSTNTSLTNGASLISASTGTSSSPLALTPNNWGYRVDNVNGFGAGPTVAQANIASSPLTFAGVPASNATPDTLANTNVSADPAAITNVWYGVCANTSTPSGTYSNQITYTAINN